MKFLYFFIPSIIVVLTAAFVYIQNYGLQKTNYNISFENLPFGFGGFKILHLTDIHRKRFGKKQKRLIALIENEKPDLIVVSGDIIYCYNHWYNFFYSYEKDLEKVLDLFRAISNKYPVYYTPGNHECKSGYYKKIREKLVKCGVIVLDSNVEILKKGNDEIAVIGLKDPTFWGGSNVVLDEYIEKNKNELINLKSKVENHFSVLISHRPEIYRIYEEAKVDIVFTGHAHGGQWIFPIIGPVYAPQQGFFPKYTSGIHSFNNTKVVINRGMGNSSMPIRLFNRPEVVVATLIRK